MKLTDDQIDRLLKIRADRISKAQTPHREGPRLRVIFGGKTGDRTPSLNRGETFQRWLPQLGSIAAAVIISLAVMRITIPSMPMRDGRTEWVTRAAKVGDTLRMLEKRQLGRAGWRRAGLVIGVSDYSGFRHPRLENLPLAVTDAARARHALESQTRAPRSHIISLLNETASETGVRAAVRWLKRFDQPGDLIVMHVASHGYAGPDQRLHIVLADSRNLESGFVTGVPVDDFLGPLARLDSVSVLICDVCNSGSVKQVALGPRQCLVASAAASEAAVDSLFSERWFAALDGSADANGDGVITLREAFDEVCRRLGGLQHPVLREGRPGLADEIVLSVNSQLLARLPQAGPEVAVPGLIEFVPDGVCQVWLDQELLGRAFAPVMLPAAPGSAYLRAVREDWTGVAGEWRDPESATVVAGRVVQRAAVFGPGTTARRAGLRLTGSSSNVLPFKRIEGFGERPSRAEISSDGIMKIERPPGPGTSGLVLIAEDAVTGADVAALTGARPGDTVSLSISAKVESGEVSVTFFAGGRATESLTPRVEKTVRLDEQWQSVTLALPAAKADRLVSGFGVSFDDKSGNPAIIFIRDLTFRR